MTSLTDRPLAFVDLETTGSRASVDRITEIAIVTLIDGETHVWSQLVNPERRIPEFIVRLTGISDELVAAAPTFAEIAADVHRRLDGCVFVAHNARFDYGFLKNEFRRVGLDLRAPVLCTVKLSRRLYPDDQRHNLDRLIERHGIVRRERHRALGDALAIHDFWQIVAAEQPAELLAATLHEAASKPSLPSWLDATDVDDIPDGCGVYLFFGENELPLYVGKSKTLRKRVLAHFAADHRDGKEMSLAQQVRRIETIKCAGEIDALLCESRLVKELQPTHNRQLRRNRECCAWRLVERADGHWRPELVHARDLERGRQQSLYGLFSNSRQANEALRKLVREHALCPTTLGLESGAPGKPCFAHQIGRCRGACTGKESPRQHGLRLQQALAELRLQTWPFAGPALLPEGEVRHVIDHWCHLGSARDESELAELLADGEAAFDRDTYRILVKHVGKMRPLPKTAAVAA